MVKQQKNKIIKGFVKKPEELSMFIYTVPKA